MRRVVWYFEEGGVVNEMMELMMIVRPCYQHLKKKSLKVL